MNDTESNQKNSRSQSEDRSTHATEIISKGPKKRVRAAAACAECNRRKVKCDVSESGKPCSRCKKGDRDCITTDSKRGKYLRVGAHTDQIEHPGAMSESSRDIDITGSATTDSVDFSLEGFMAQLASASALQTPSSSPLISNGTSTSASAVLPMSNLPSIPEPSVSTADIRSSDDTCGFAGGTNFPIGYSPLQDKQQSDAAEASDLREQHVWVDLMAVRDEALDQQDRAGPVTYATDLFTLSHVLRRHWKHQSGVGVPASRVHFSSDSIQQPGQPSERPSAEQAIETEYLSRLGCFTLPPQIVLDKLVEAYFAWFHPVYPVLHRAKFENELQRVMTGSMSLLLLWGLLYVSASLVSIQYIKMAGFKSRFQALRSFSQRGKALYATKYEEDKVNVVLFEFYISQIWGEGEDSHLWAGRASSTAQSLGMHRSTANATLPIATQRLWRRIWWCVYIRDKHSAIATGRPFRIIDGRMNDVELPQRDDFDTEKEYQFLSESAKLAQILTHTAECRLAVKPASQKSERDTCYRLLDEWLENLPRELSPSNPMADTLCIFMQLSYHCWVIHLFRETAADDDSNPVASRSAAAVTRLFEDLLQRDEVGQVPQFAVTSLFAAMAQHLLDRHSRHSALGKLSGHRLAICRMAAKELSAARPVAVWIRKMFQHFDTSTPPSEETVISAQQDHQQDHQHATTAPLQAGGGFASTSNTEGTYQPQDTNTYSNFSNTLFGDLFWGMPTEFTGDVDASWFYTDSA